MIYTFIKKKSGEQFMLYAKNKNEAFNKMNEEFGSSSNTWVLIGYCEVESFKMFIP